MSLPLASINAAILAANNAPAGSLFKKSALLDKLPRLKSPETFTQVFPFSTNMKFKVKLYKQDDEGMQELENQSKRIDSVDIRKGQTLLDMSLYETIYIQPFIKDDDDDDKDEIKMMTILECAYELYHVITDFLENQDIWDPVYVKCGGLYLSLNDVHVFFNIEKMFFVAYKESSFQTILNDSELPSDFFENKNFFLLKLVLSHFLELFLKEREEEHGENVPV